MAGWILIFDDDLHTRMVIGRVFAKRGYIVIETTRAAAVLECTERLDLACVFLAAKSSEGDGIALLRLLIESQPDLPVVFVADHFNGRIGQVARLHGARCCLQRPIPCAVIEGLAAEMLPAHGQAAVPVP